MKKFISILLSASLFVGVVNAQTDSSTVSDTLPVNPAVEKAKAEYIMPDSTVALVDSIYLMPDSTFLVPRSTDEIFAHLDSIDMSSVDPHWRNRRLPRYTFRPAVYDCFVYADSTTFDTPLYSGCPETRWIEEEDALYKRQMRMQRHLFFKHPNAVAYNINLLPEAPKRFHAVVDPQKHTIEIHENLPEGTPAATLEAKKVEKKHWIKTFNASLHFSQAYVSPNWYQGGNNNTNILGNAYYNVKLNPEYHPDILFETTAQYKLGINSSPSDSIHDFNISDDLLQINTTLGLKAVNKWYYSFNAQFKTQLFKNYPSNSHNVRSSFLSPGELTAGVGMTYNNTNEKRKMTFDASIAPLSYSLRTCINAKIDPTNYNVDAGHTTKHKFGSSADLKYSWKIYYNITLLSHLFIFSDYDGFQADWENTINFDITHFLTTKIYIHARYDSKTPKLEDSSWKKLQIKEILSFGVSYKFSSI